MPGGDDLARRAQPLPQTLEERLTTQFYDWERRGRGWQIWPYIVDLEPPFQPFFFHSVEAPPSVDDGRRPTFWSSLIERLSATSRREEARSIKHISDTENEEAVPIPFTGDTHLTELQVALPPAVKTSKESAERFLLSLKYCVHPVGFEIAGTKDAIVTALSCRDPDRPQVRQQLQAHFPEAVVTEHEGFLGDRWDRSKTGVIADFGLSHEFMLPLRTFRGFEADPLIGIVGALADLQENEVGLLQILFRAARYPWAESIVRAVTDWDGHAFFSDAPQMLSLTKEKVAQPLFAVVIRVAAQSESFARSWEIVKGLGGALAQFANPASNELIPLTNDGYDDEDHAVDLLARQSRRSGMLLNADELVSFVHLPSASVRVPKLTREERKTKAAPAIVIGHRYILGENTHSGRTIQVSLSPEARSRHCHVIGTSGTGKSTLLLNLILQDIEHGEGVALLDPHGDLVDEVLSHIPERRLNDVLLLDPSDEAWPVGFNVLQAHSEIEKNLLGSDLVAVFRRLSTSWGDQMTSVLGNAVLAMLENEQGGTLVDLRRFLIEPEFRKKFLKTVRDSEVVYYWEKSFPLLAGKPQGPILTRLDTFLRPKLIRSMVAQKEDRLDFGVIMNSGKIFLAKLAQGAIGEENAYLLGTLLVSKFQQTAMSRQQMAASARRNFYLYIDEFHHFVTPSMAAILSGARKYRLGLVLAHQELRQVESRDTDVASAVISNPSTRICFRLGDADAKKIAEGFSYFAAKDLQNLEVGEAICRVERAENDFNLKTLPLPPMDAETAMMRHEKVVALSRERYARPRAEIEAMFASTIPREDETLEEPNRAPAFRREKTGPREDRVAEKTGTTPAPPARLRREMPRAAIPSPGRGGAQHKYLQELIKRWAESKGYHATIEKQILDGLGSVDVALEKERGSMACEISISTSPEHETANIQKCLAAGFGQVFLISSERKTLSKVMENLSTNLSEEDQKRVRTLTPEEFFAFVETLEAERVGTEKKVRGYKVKVQYKPVGEEEKREKKQAISQVVLGALKRLKGGKK